MRLRLRFDFEGAKRLEAQQIDPAKALQDYREGSRTDFGFGTQRKIEQDTAGYEAEQELERIRQETERLKQEAENKRKVLDLAGQVIQSTGGMNTDLLPNANTEVIMEELGVSMFQGLPLPMRESLTRQGIPNLLSPQETATINLNVGDEAPQVQTVRSAQQARVQPGDQVGPISCHSLLILMRVMYPYKPLLLLLSLVN